MEPFLQWASLTVGICSFGYPACKANEPYCRLWPAPLKNIFPHYFINGRIFEKKRCLFSLQLLSETFLILRRNERDMMTKMTTGLHVKYPLFLSDFNETRVF